MSYGCFNRAPYVSSIPVADGWYMDGYTRTPRMVSMPFRMSPDCEYTLSDLGQADAGCLGCKWRKTDDAERAPETPAVVDGTPVHGGFQGPLLAPSTGDSPRPGDGGSAKPADSGDAKALERKYPNAQIYRRTEE